MVHKTDYTYTDNTLNTDYHSSLDDLCGTNYKAELYSQEYKCPNLLPCGICILTNRQCPKHFNNDITFTCSPRHDASGEYGPTITTGTSLPDNFITTVKVK